MTTSRTLTAAALSVTVGLALAPAAVASSTGLGRFYNQTVQWKSCRQSPDDEVGKKLDEAGAQCADITVPLDYARPDGRTITVAMSRLRATDTAHRIGTMLLNGGGPAGTAIDMPPDMRDIMKDTGRKYDLVGMDPRFVGRSTPLDCGWPTGHWLRSAGLDRAGFDRMTTFAADLAERCKRHAGEILPHVTTRNTARDMDIVRGVLGEPKISYLGYSYGTYLGAVYTQMFPGRTDRVVFDGALDPRKYGMTMFTDFAAVNERALHAWAAWAAARDDTYHLGQTRRAVLAAVDQIIDASAHKPLHVGSFRIDEHLVSPILINGLSDDRDQARASLADAMRVLHDAAVSGSAEPGSDLAEMLRFLLTGAESSYGSAQISIFCGDAAAPRDPEWYWRNIQRSRTRTPVAGPTVNNISPCAFWPQPPRERPTGVGNSTPALIVASTGDPRTLYQYGQGLHHLMTGSRLLTLKNAIIHGVYGNYGNTCVDDQVTTYLDTGVLPTHDTTCTARETVRSGLLVGPRYADMVGHPHRLGSTVGHGEGRR